MSLNTRHEVALSLVGWMPRPRADQRGRDSVICSSTGEQRLLTPLIWPEGVAHFGAGLFLLELLFAVLEVTSFDGPLGAVEGAEPAAGEFALGVGAGLGLQAFELGRFETAEQLVFEREPELE